MSGMGISFSLGNGAETRQFNSPQLGLFGRENPQNLQVIQGIAAMRQVRHANT
jgi:hypothetical protein